MADGGRGGDGGNGNGGDAYAGAGTGGDGGRGGDGGTASANAGSFDMSNAMNGSSNAAAGIMMVAQNSGASSLIQQGVTVQEIGRAHVRTPVTNANLGCRPLLGKK